MLLEVRSVRVKVKNPLTVTSRASRVTLHQTPELNALEIAMIRGYQEMSKINLKLSTECLYVEYEAEYVVERLMSGG